ncbi:MAG: hypothetical protein QOF48_3718 [Verrucomicrobiota bacterium]
MHFSLESHPQKPAVPLPQRTPSAGPRKKHSHRCKRCGQGVYCYKTHCTKPQRVTTCTGCR